MGVRQDLTEYRVAIKRRYEISDEMKKKMLEFVSGVFSDPLASNREKVAAAKVLIAAEQQNQADEKLLSDNARILEFAERMGIRKEVEEAAQGTAGSVAGFIDQQEHEE